MAWDAHSMPFENSCAMDILPEDMGSFYYGPGSQEDGNDEFVQTGPAHFRSMLPLPRLPRFDDDDADNQDHGDDQQDRGPSALPRLGHVGDTFGGEYGQIDDAIPVVHVSSADEGESERIDAYYGEDIGGMCHAIVANAGYAALESPAKLRKLVSSAIAQGPIPAESRLVPIERYENEEDFTRAFSAFSISAYAGPSALVLDLPDRSITLLASGSEIIVVDPRDQPGKPTLSGLPRLMGDGALVMRCRNHLEVSSFIRSRYRTRPASGQLFLLQPVVAGTTETGAVTKSVAALSLDPAQAMAKIACLQRVISDDFKSSSDKQKLEELKSTTTQWKSSQKPVKLKHVETMSQEPAQAMIQAIGQVFTTTRTAALAESTGTLLKNPTSEWKGKVKADELKKLYQGAEDQPIVDALSGVAPVSTGVEEEKNKEGKRERSPTSVKPTALGSPLRMDSDEEEAAGAEKPKRAKTPPLAVAAGVQTTTIATPAVKAERRKSAPKSAARTSGTATVPSAPAVTAAKRTTTEAAPK